MDTHKKFQKFDARIALDDPKCYELERQRDSIRNKIRDYFRARRWKVPKFYSQGSFPLRTDLNPLPGDEYDLDDGVYFICPAQERMTPDVYHGRVRSAVEGRTSDIKDKDTCVRVIYAGGHHIDFPIYWTDSASNIPRFAHKRDGYTESDPVGFMNWVEAKIKGNGQLRRIIRYLKAWADWRERSNPDLKLPAGFILTILACRYYSGAPERDDIAFTNTVFRIFKALSKPKSFECYRPTVPTNDDILERYDAGTCLRELGMMVDSAKKAVSAPSVKQACSHWRKIFGDRFPPNGGSHTKKPVVPPPTRSKVNPLWGSL